MEKTDAAYLHLGSIHAVDMRQPVVSLRMATTSMLTSPLLLLLSLLLSSCSSYLSMASLSSPTTSCPSTWEHLNPLVHWASLPWARPSWIRGKEKVKPRGRERPCNPLLSMKVLRQEAM